MLRRVLGPLLFLWLSLPAAAQSCRLALALGFDVSRSVDAADYRIQIDGIIAALSDPEIRAAMLEPALPVALAIYEWSGEHEQILVADWRLIRSGADADALVAQVAAHTRRHAGLTGVGAALAWGHRLLARAPPCLWRTLDISGDGYNNVGPPPARVYARYDFGAITVNGLAIGGHESRILHWYTAEVARGPGAFVEFAPTHRDFAEVFRRKLWRELTEPVLSGLWPPLQPASAPASARSIRATVSSIP